MKEALAAAKSDWAKTKPETVGRRTFEEPFQEYLGQKGTSGDNPEHLPVQPLPPRERVGMTALRAGIRAPFHRLR